MFRAEGPATHPNFEKERFEWLKGPPAVIAIGRVNHQRDRYLRAVEHWWAREPDEGQYLPVTPFCRMIRSVKH